ncbi:lipoprotein [Providencia manganoxydans]
MLQAKHHEKSLVGLSALIILLSLSGCGLKGPLYFPPEEQATPAKASDVEPKAADSTAAQSPTSVSNPQ